MPLVSVNCQDIARRAGTKAAVEPSGPIDTLLTLSLIHIYDPNIQDLYYFGENYNTNTVDNFLMPREDPRNPGLFYGIDAPEFGTHCAGQIVSITGATNLNAFYMRVNYLTPRSTHEYASSPTNIPPDDTCLLYTSRCV